ncbi:MAG TPA: excinuclease ABC subunit UvrA [candidate division Zixibacteria bacterium]|nr:excinuclease ABC subunit UvrA [candidate division Zixibacteria bacterium]
MRDTITVKGARTNNLKNIDVNIPRDKITVLTGVSGSGKTSLAFDVIFGEAQRKFFESMSASSRSMLPMLERADVDSILGLSPVVAIEQKTGTYNPRSTIGTMTDISSYMRILFSVIGQVHCPYCNVEIETRNANQIVDHLMTLPEGTSIEILAPVNKIYEEDYSYLFDDIRQKGYKRIKIDSENYSINDKIELDEDKDYQIEVLVDKFVIKQELHQQLAISIENAKNVGSNLMRFEFNNEEISDEIKKKFYKDFGCKKHHIIFHKLLPGGFSPNLPDHSCPTCLGVGTLLKAEPYLMVKDSRKSIAKGALVWYPKYWMFSITKLLGFDINAPYKDLPEDVRYQLIHGIENKFTLLEPPDWPNKYRHRDVGKEVKFLGILNYIDRFYRHDRKKGERYEWYRKFMAEHVCPDCYGQKLIKQRLLVTVNGKNIHELGEYFIDHLLEFINNIEPPKEIERAANQVLFELKKRIQLLIDIGLYYLRLNRQARTLSAGEAQRIKLSTQLGSELMGMLYVLDEPSIGLHVRDSNKIIDILKRLRDTGNTVIVIEHDLETIKQADYILELGPGPGVHGGNIVAQGTYEEVLLNPKFLTGHYLLGKKQIPYLGKARKPNGKTIKVIGARENNLKNIDVEFPLGIFICITGVSGSGKSTLIEDVLGNRLLHDMRDQRILPGKHDEVLGVDNIVDVRIVDQSPIGRHSRSTPATYVGFYDKIRQVFADTQEAKRRGYTYGRFSYNNHEGRCAECNGEGLVRIELQYMPNIQTVCPECKGARYNEEILEINYNGKNLGEVLDMTIEEANGFFKDIRLIAHKTKTLMELGLGYLKLGQPAPTLSGGESQRIKLAKELGKLKKLKDNLYIMDEPTVGLHMEDIQKLLKTIHKLVDAGNTVIVIEHHLDVIKSADWVIDLGPEGGAEGGEVITQGTVEDIVKCKNSYTGQFLKQHCKI